MTWNHWNRYLFWKSLIMIFPEYSSALNPPRIQLTHARTKIFCVLSMFHTFFIKFRVLTKNKHEICVCVSLLSRKFSWNNEHVLDCGLKVTCDATTQHIFYLRTLGRRNRMRLMMMKKQQKIYITLWVCTLYTILNIPPAIINKSRLSIIWSKKINSKY